LGFASGVRGELRFGFGFLLDYHFHPAGYVFVQANWDIELAQIFQRVVELDFAPVNVEALLFQSSGNVGRGD
jgi:hypothetical protein